MKEANVNSFGKWRIQGADWPLAFRAFAESPLGYNLSLESHMHGIPKEIQGVKVLNDHLHFNQAFVAFPPSLVHSMEKQM